MATEQIATNANAATVKRSFAPDRKTVGLAVARSAPLQEISTPVKGLASAGRLTTAEVLLRGLERQQPAKISAAVVSPELLVIESDTALSKALYQAGQQMGFSVKEVSPSEAARSPDSFSCDIVLLELEPNPESMALLRALRQQLPRVPIIVTTSVATVGTAVEAMRQGATDYLAKPFSLEELTATLHNAAERRTVDIELKQVQLQLRKEAGTQQLVSFSPTMRKLVTIVARVAPASHPLLMLGESGAGKEYVARMLHRAHWQVRDEGSDEKAARSRKPAFVTVQCGSMPAHLLQDELFGSDTLATPGILSRDGGGTLFLDEVEALPLDLQSKLLRALQDRGVKAAGNGELHPLTVRVVASSSVDLARLVDRGAFRKDLYFRLNVVALRVPPLRERREDLPTLAAILLDRCGRDRGMHFELGADALRVLLGYSWPGNVRELEAAMERACTMSTGPVLATVDLPSQVRNSVVPEADPGVMRYFPSATQNQPSFGEEISSIAEMERKAIVTTLKTLKGDKLASARALGIGKTTLYRKLKEYGIADAG